VPNRLYADMWENTLFEIDSCDFILGIYLTLL